MKVKTCPAKVKAAGEQDGTDDGVFEAIVATYDLDSYGDKIVPGAFADTLKDWQASGDPIPVLWSHNSFDPDCHIGVVEEAEERKGVGLWVKARLDLDSPKAAQVYRLLKGRRVTQFSFAYDVLDGGFVEQKDGDTGQDESYYELRKLKLFEVGPCLIGANQQTELLDVKSGELALSAETIAKLAEAIAKNAPAPTVTVTGSPIGTRYFWSSTSTTPQISGGQPPAKVGRTLSAKNQDDLVIARDALNRVLDTANDAPSDDDAKRRQDTEPVESPAAKASDRPADPDGSRKRRNSTLERLALDAMALDIDD